MLKSCIIMRLLIGPENWLDEIEVFLSGRVWISRTLHYESCFDEGCSTTRD